MGGIGAVGAERADMHSTGQAEGTSAIKQKPIKKESNSVDQAPTSKPGSETGCLEPTRGAREATTPKPLTRQEIEKEAEERLMSDPAYRAAKEKFELLQSIKDGFNSIDGGVQGFSFDGIVELWDLQALADRNDAPEAAKKAALALLAHPEIWRELAGKDNQVGLHEFAALLDASRQTVSAMKDGAKAEIKAEDGQRLAATPNSATGTTAQGAPATGVSNGATATQTAEEAKKAEEAAKKEAAAKAIMAEADQALPKPAPSQFSGLEGASENMNNMIGWAESEMDRLTTLMGKTDDPAVLKQLETKVNQMSRRMQQMTALMNQLMTAMQNISKMYSDIAMNSVRNIR